MKDNSIAPSEM